MLDDDRTKKPPDEPRRSSLSKWIDGLGAAEKLLAGLTAVVVAIGVLGTGVYYARNAWIRIFGPTGNAGAPARRSQAEPDKPFANTDDLRQRPDKQRKTVWGRLVHRQWRAGDGQCLRPSIRRPRALAHGSSYDGHSDPPGLLRKT
jgi:hypothetical protein